MEARDYMVGETVQVHAFGHWYVGEVVHVGPKRITVLYTSGSGVVRKKAGSPKPYPSKNFPGETMPQLVRKIGERTEDPKPSFVRY
jgi:hypothetical protein